MPLLRIQCEEEFLSLHYLSKASRNHDLLLVVDYFFKMLTLLVILIHAFSKMMTLARHELLQISLRLQQHAYLRQHKEHVKAMPTRLK